MLKSHRAPSEMPKLTAPSPLPAGLKAFGTGLCVHAVIVGHRQNILRVKALVLMCHVKRLRVVIIAYTPVL